MKEIIFHSTNELKEYLNGFPEDTEVSLTIEVENGGGDGAEEENE